MSEFVIRQSPVLKDNYADLLHEPASGASAMVDPSVAEPVLAALGNTGWRLSHILNTAPSLGSHRRQRGTEGGDRCHRRRAARQPRVHSRHPA